MKQKGKAIASSIVAIAMSASLAVGGTFALFTSESEVDIAVTSGKVDVKASVENFEYKTLTQDWTVVNDSKTEFDGLGGSAVLDGDVLTLDKIVPGDAVRFDVKVTNESNVIVKYRTAVRNLSEDGTLFNALEVSVNDEDFSFSKISSWSALDPSVSDVETISLVIEFPETAEGQELMGKTANMLVSVEAIQGNAETSDDALAGTFNEFVNALNTGKPVTLTDDIIVPGNVEITSNATINGKGYEIKREDGYTGNIFTVKASSSLTLNDVIIDGGAIWEEPVGTFSLRNDDDQPLLYGVQNKVNNGVMATGALITTEGDAVLTLGEDVILKNNDGANAIALATRAGGKLIINGAKIINNRSDAGAIYGGTSIEFNDGEISGNHANWAGGAIRFVNNFGTFVMNGGKMNYNTSSGFGGAIYLGNGTSDWSFNNTNSVAIFNGGEVAYNRAATTGGVIHCAGQWNKVVISGDVEIHDNTSADLGAAIRFHAQAMLIMNGGKVYNNVTDNGHGAFYAWNVSISLLGGEIYNDNGADIDYEISTDGGLGQLYGSTRLDRPILLTVSQNVKTISLAEGFNFSFKINSTLNENTVYTFVPYEGYEYTEGDESRIVCMNEGYSTYWDAATGTFCVMA